MAVRTPWRVLAGRCGAGADFQSLEDAELGFRDFGALPERAVRTGEGAHVYAVELATQVRPGITAGVLGDPGEEERQPAQQDVGADPVFPCGDRPAGGR